MRSEHTHTQSIKKGEKQNNPKFDEFWHNA